MGKRKILKRAITSAVLFSMCIMGTIAFAASSDGTSDGNYVSTDNYYDVSEYTDEEGNVTKSASEVFPSNEYDGYWTKLSEDTWMYTFYVYDTDVSYYVYEDAVPDGFTANYTISEPYQLSDGTEVATIVNTSDHLATYGSLTISKTVVDTDGNETNDSTSFAVKVTIYDDDGELLEGNKIFGDTAFSDGVGYITLASGDSITLTDIPVGYTYYVEEVDYGSYTPSYSGQSGEISEDGSEVSITNTKENTTTTVTETEEPEYVSVTLTKTLSGYYEKTDAEYTFYVSLSGLEQSGTYVIDAGDAEISFTADKNGDATVSVTLAADESITIEDIPVGVTYQFTEVAGDYIASYEITDANDTGSISTSSKANSNTDTSLSTDIETADSGEAITVTYTNYLEKTVDVSLTKVSLNADGSENDSDTDSYEITATFAGLSSYGYIYSDIGKITADDEGNAKVTFDITAGEVIVFEDVPVGATYSFEETANSKTASYIVTDANESGTIASESGSNSENNTALSTETETANEDEEITVTFINTTSEASVKVYKTTDDGTPLEGAVFSIYTSDGALVAEEITTGEDGYSEIMDGFGTGTYTVVETEAPSGYFLTAPISFTIEEDDLGETVTVVVKDNVLQILSSTGGAGIYALIFGSLCILTITLVILYRRRKHA